ncbi:MAG: glycosyltransferase [Bacteroidetes bacterium]|nr:glycosyltransferase [Bacteroidota bacterium]
MKTTPKSPLIHTNDLSLFSNGVWSKDHLDPFLYTDGEAAEESLEVILTKAKDRSSLSIELEKSSYDWISHYHLSSDRANIYRFFNLMCIGKALELGGGCGAISRYLGELDIDLDVIEGNVKRAGICRLRCEELDNVEVIHSNFNDLTLPNNTYDAVFLNGVLEYAQKFSPSTSSDKDAALQILAKGLESLTPSGTAFIAIENRMGLKYWLGAKEDHYGRPDLGLYDYPNSCGIRTYDKKEWEEMLSDLGEEFTYRFIYPFPDYKMAKVVLRDGYLTNNDFAHSHLYRVFSSDNDSAIQTSKNEFLLWKSLHRKEQFENFSNSFVILISKSEEKLEEICDHDFMHFSGKGRKPEYRTVTSKKRNVNSVNKNYTHGAPMENEVLNHDISEAPFFRGTLLITHWVESLAGGDSEIFNSSVREYFNFIKKLFSSDTPPPCVDLLPFNIVITPEGEWKAIDNEWVVKFPLSPEFLLFRALLWFPSGNESLLNDIFAGNNISTIKDFIEYQFQLLSLTLEGYLHEFIEKEETLQSQISDQIRENPIENMLLQPLARLSESTSSQAFVTQIYWREKEVDWSEDKSLTTPGITGEETQTLSFNLPPTINQVDQLRFDPADRSGFFTLHNFVIYPAIDDTLAMEDKAWKLEGNQSISAYSHLENVEYCQKEDEDIFLSTGNDPHFIINLPSHVQEWLRDHGIMIKVVMDWPRSSDYQIVMDTLGQKVVKQEEELKRLSIIEQLSQDQADRIFQQAAKLKETSDQVRSKDIYIDTLENEIEAMKNTRVWRAAEILRMKVYYRLLDTRTLVSKGINTLRREGPVQFVRKVKQQLIKKPDSATLGLNRPDYNLWIEHNRLTEYDIEEIKNNISEFRFKPLFSIVVPVYDVDQEWLERTIDSVRLQLYENWELCLCDDLSPSPHVKKVLQQYADLDSRIKILFKEKNEGIALTSNAALKMATGDYIGLLDHDDEITREALYENAKVINEHPGVGLIYSDEDKLDMQGRRCDPFFKPDFSPELIRSQNYICHFTVIKKSILDELGGFRSGFDGSQDHDLILRCLEKTSKVYHIPKILYHWRKIPGSTAAVYSSKSYAWEAGRKAVEDSMERVGVPGETTFAKYQGSYRVRNTIKDTPLITIIIPFKDKGELLETAISSILEKTVYTKYEILGVSNNSTQDETHQLMKTLSDKDSRVRFMEYDVPFNFSEINNYAVEHAQGEYVVLLNNDIEIISPEWLNSMLELAQLSEVGAVGGKLYYPDNRIQHSGIVIGMAGVAGPPHYLFHRDDVGYYARAHVIHNVSAVTGACLMVKKELYKLVGGMDSEHFGVAYNDIDLCLKLRQKGYRNVFTPYCEMYHFESQSRGYEDTPEKQERLERESNVFRQRWEKYFDEGDPYYSPHLSLDVTNFTIKLH